MSTLTTNFQFHQPVDGDVVEVWGVQNFAPDLATLDARLIDYSYNVKAARFGATGLGVTGDSAAIQSAISAGTAASGTWVFLPPGKYLFDTTVTLANYVSIYGMGRATQIIPKAGMAGPLFTGTSGVGLTGVTIRDLFLNGQGVSGLTASNPGIQLWNATGCHIHHNVIRWTGGSGILMPLFNASVEEHLNWITLNEIEFTQSHGIEILDSNADTMILGNEIGLSGLTTPLVFAGAKAVDGIHLSNTGGTQKILDNHIHQSGNSQIFVGGAGDTLIVGNMLEKCVSHGITLSSSNSVNITANTVREVDELSAGNVDGIHLVDSDKCLIVANRVKDGRFGLAVIASSTNIVITNNNAVGNNMTGVTTAAEYWQSEGEHLMNATSAVAGSGGVAYGFRRALTFVGNIAIPSMANNTFGTFTATLAGCQIGDTVAVGIQNIGAVAAVVSGQVSASGNVFVTIHNGSGSQLNLGTQSVRIDVFQHS